MALTGETSSSGPSGFLENCHGLLDRPGGQAEDVDDDDDDDDDGGDGGGGDGGGGGSTMFFTYFAFAWECPSMSLTVSQSFI